MHDLLMVINKSAMAWHLCVFKGLVKTYFTFLFFSK
jgi:hypothetical protein